MDIAEKSAISTHANTGAYRFASGEMLNFYVEELLNKCGDLQSTKQQPGGELYTNAVIHAMLTEGVQFKGVFV